jgi:hypothetical protein
MLPADAAAGRTRVPLVSSKTEQTGGFGQGDAKAIVQLLLLADPTVTRPALSLPPMEGEVPQSLAPEPIPGVAPVVI